MVDLTEDIDRLRADRADVVKTVAGDGVGIDIDAPGVRGQRGSRVADEASLETPQPVDGNIACGRGDGGEHVDPSAARARDAAQDDAFAAGEGIVDGHAVRRRGQRGAVG